MRTAAGVILIIAAVFNLVAGLTWLGGGALTQGVSTGMSQGATQMEK